MPGERHPQELLHVFGGGLIRDLLPHGRMDMFWGCLSPGTASGSIVHQQLSPTESTTTTFPTFIPPRGASRWRAAPRWRESLAPANERRGSTAQRAIPPPLLDLGHRPVGWGTRRHLRRHAVVRRESPRCQTSCAPDGHAWGVVAPRGVPARGGCGGGLVGSQEDCALLASWPGRCGGRPPM